MLDRQYIDDHHLVPRYLADQLGEQERAQFEAYVLDNPAMVDELEAAARLKTGLAELQRSGELNTLVSPRPSTRRWVLAAGLVAFVVAVSLMLVRPAPKRPLLAAMPAALTDAQGKPLPVVATRYVMRLRSGSYDAQLDLTTAAQALELRVLPEAAEHTGQYRIDVIRVDETQPPRPIGSLGKLLPQADGYIAVYLDTSQLSPGLYELRLAADASERGPVSVFLLHALRR
jgi:hypothetical protein